MELKHRIIINVSDSVGQEAEVLKAAKISLPSRVLKFFFGDFQQVYLLSPGRTVASVDVTVANN